MKKILFPFMIIAISFISKAQVVDVIPGVAIGATDAVVVGDDIYISEIFSQRILRVDLTNPTPTVNATFAIPDVITFIVEGSTAYVIDLFGTIYSADVSDFTSNMQVLGSTTSLSISTDLILIDNFLYFSELNTNSISRVDLNNPGTVELVVDGINGPQGLALIGDELFIANSGGDSIDKINITDTNPIVEVVATGVDNPGGLIAVGSVLYISEPALTSGRILSIDTAISNPTPVVLATNLQNPIGIATYNSDVYFVQSGNGNLSRLEDIILSVDDQNELANTVVVSPNPSTGSITFSGLETAIIEAITVYDLTGRVVSQVKLNSTQSEANKTATLDIASGTYIININTDQGMVNRKIIIQ